MDNVGGGTLAQSAAWLREGGRAVSITDPQGVEELKDRGVNASFVFVAPDAAELTVLARMCEDGELSPHVSEVLPLTEAARAQELSEAGHTRGKIVLEIA
jgi:NADPH:quinone reductase-like Zn-dependent oxidoreductase